MAKRKGRRKFRRYLRGNVQIDLGLGTMGQGTALAQVNGGSVEEAAYLSSVKCTYTLQSFVKADDIGPIIVGVAHSDYTAGEIEAWIENQGSWKSGDLISQEIAKRKIRMVGTFESPDAVEEDSTLNDGRPIHTKCGWMLTTGQRVQAWAYNSGTTATTGSATVHVEGHANVWPK